MSPCEESPVRIEGDLEVVELVPGGGSADSVPAPGRPRFESDPGRGPRRHLDRDPDRDPDQGPAAWLASGRPLVRVAARAAAARAAGRIRRIPAAGPAVDAAASTIARIPQRAKLVIALLAVAATGFVALGISSAVVLRDYVTDRADAQLRETSADISAAPSAVLSPRSGEFGLPERRMYFYIARPLPQGVAAQLRSDDGSTFREFGLLSWSGASGPLLPGDLAARRGHPFTAPARATNDRWRILVTTPVVGSTLIVATNFTGAAAVAGRLTQIALVAGGLALALMAGIGFRAVRSGTPHLAEIERTVEAAVAGDLTRRVPVPAGDAGPSQVAHAVNVLIEQVGAARAAEERAVRRVGEADRAVRLPLSVIQGFADYYREVHREPGRPGEPRPEHDPVRMARLVDRVGDEAARIGAVLRDLAADVASDVTRSRRAADRRDPPGAEPGSRVR
jgi:two-component system OmpR family sensor kinase